MQNKTISFETAESAVMQTWKSLLKQTNPYLVPILLPMIEHFKPLFQEFYDLGVSHGRTAQAVPEWISVKDRLPKRDALVAWVKVHQRNGVLEKWISQVDGICWADCHDGYHRKIEDIDATHWILLPDPPVAQEPAND